MITAKKSRTCRDVGRCGVIEGWGILGGSTEVSLLGSLREMPFSALAKFGSCSLTSCSLLLVYRSALVG